MAEKRLSQDELAARITEAERLVTVGAEYEHYKHARYLVLQVALLEATNEPCVIYQAQYGERLTFVRPVSSWLEQVEIEGRSVPRFAKV
jgi:hypothetical protein